MTLLLALLQLSCTSSPEVRRARELEAAGGMPSTVEVQLTPPRVTGAFRWEKETVARVLRTFEAHLHAAPGVVVRVGERAPPLGVRSAPKSRLGPWDVSFAMVGSPASLTLEAQACGPREGCDKVVVNTNAEATELGASEAAVKVMAMMGVNASAETLECLSGPPSRDAYASLVAGRGAAVLYGLVEPAIDGDRSKDPSERAVYLDPSMGLAQWVAGRRRFARDELDNAAYSLREAHEACPTHMGFAADLAQVEMARGKVRRAVELVEGLGDVEDDPRLVQLRLDTWIRTDRLQQAEALGQRANQTFPDDPHVAEVLANLAVALNKPEDHEVWLNEWMKRSPEDPEPVRRLVSILALGGRWNEAWDAAAELEKRGESDEAQRWRVTVGLALGRYDEAAASADPHVATRIRARATLEGAAGGELGLQGDMSAEARLARGTAAYQKGDGATALAEAEAALRQIPYLPEALALRADALQSLRESTRAEAARRTWRQAEPPARSP